AGRQEAEPELLDRQSRLPDHLVNEQADDDEHAERGGGSDEVEGPVADAVAKPGPAEGEAPGCRGRGCAHPATLKPCSNGLVGRSPVRPQIGTDPLPPPRISAA